MPACLDDCFRWGSRYISAIPSQSTKMATQACNDFAFKLYQEMSKNTGNVLVCPFSAHVILTLIHQGASGNTAKELAAVLSLKGSNEEIKESYKSVLTGIQDETVKVATKLYSAEGFKIKDEFLSLAHNYFLSDVENVDFKKSTEAANKINNYIQEKTKNTINDLISPDSLTELTTLVVVNAVYFNATWDNPFDQWTPYNSHFKVTPEEMVDVCMMTRTKSYHYKEDPALEAQVLKIDYNEEGYSMIFILPNKEDGLPALEAILKNESLETILANMKSRPVNIHIPKFKMELSINLKDMLTKMGVTDLFSPSHADLSNVADGGLFVSQVLQKTFILVNERGTMASAASYGLFEYHCLRHYEQPPVFQADHPFFFGIIHNSNTVLFCGRLSRP